MAMRDEKTAKRKVKSSTLAFGHQVHMKLDVLLVFCFLILSAESALALQCERRHLCRAIGFAGATALLPPQEAMAERGAAELDFEYYMRDLIGGNAREGNIQRSKPPPVTPPRKLTEPLLSLLLNNDFTSDCVSCRALLEQLPNSNANQISQQAMELRSKVAPSFSTRALWNNQDVSDQYYFDLSSYALWRTAAERLPNFVARNDFAQSVGRMLYQELHQRKILTNSPEGKQLTDMIPTMKEILDLFQSSGFCSAYSIGDEKSPKIFDDADNEDLASGFAVDCLVSLIEPATLGASLQITGEQSRFTPEFVGTTLVAMWASVSITASYETYFVDNTYRPNPKDYFPNEQLLQFTLKR